MKYFSIVEDDECEGGRFEIAELDGVTSMADAVAATLAATASEYHCENTVRVFATYDEVTVDTREAYRERCEADHVKWKANQEAERRRLYELLKAEFEGT